MRQPVRDERWTDPTGETWQVCEIKKLKPYNGRRGAVAFYRMRHVSGITAKVKPQEVRDWRRTDGIPEGRNTSDPFEGKRIKISQSIRDGAKVIVFTEAKCPVVKGELYHLPCGQILIDKVSRKIIKARGAEWQVEFIRQMRDRDYFLRSIVPGAKQGETPGNATPDEVERARIDGNYRHSPERDGDELPAVPPDWIDKAAPARDLNRISSQRAVQNERQIQAAKSRINRLLRSGTPKQVETLLAAANRVCDEVEGEDLGKVA